MASSSSHSASPNFWHDIKLPFVEMRSIKGARSIGYAKHSHESFSIGAITGGKSTYLNGKMKEQVSAGTVVIINPEEMHACNPVVDEPWSYHMLYVDHAWLATLQHELGFSANADFRPFSTTSTNSLFVELTTLCGILADEHADHLQKHGAVIDFFSMLQNRLDPASTSSKDANVKLMRAAEFIKENFNRSLKLEEICAAAELSPAYLIRAFKHQFGMTPHAYLINHRIQQGRAQLRRGHAIADIALDIGFSDQAHFQRAFKQHLAATPGQYRGRG